MVLSKQTIPLLDKDKRGFKLALTSGCFDLLHSGHIYYLNQMRSLAGEAKTLVIIHGDKAVAKHKSRPLDPRPIFPAEHRALILDNIRAVDYVYIWEGWEDVVELVRQIKPDMLIAPQLAIDRANWSDSWSSVSREIGAQLKGIPRVDKDISTSKFIAQIRNAS